MNLNTKQQTLQYHTIPDGGGDDVVVPRPTPWWTGRSYSVLGGLVLLLVAAAVVLQGDRRINPPWDHDPRPEYTPPPMAYTPPPMAAEGMVLASITTLQNDAEDGRGPGGCGPGRRFPC